MAYNYVFFFRFLLLLLALFTITFHTIISSNVLQGPLGLRRSPFSFFNCIPEHLSHQKISFHRRELNPTRGQWGQFMSVVGCSGEEDAMGSDPPAGGSVCHGRWGEGVRAVDVAGLPTVRVQWGATWRVGTGHHVPHLHGHRSSLQHSHHIHPSPRLESAGEWTCSTLENKKNDGKKRDETLWIVRVT